MVRSFLTKALIVVIISCSMVSVSGPKKFGVSPWTSGQLLHAWMNPVLLHLEQSTNKDYQLTSAKSLNDYLVKAANNEFDVIMIPMHMGLFLMDRFRFKPVVFVRGTASIYIVANSNFPIYTLHDLKGMTLSTADPIAITGMMTEKLLNENKIPFQWQYAGNQWNIMDQLLKGEVQAGPIVGKDNFLTHIKFKNKLRLLYTFPIKLDGIMVVHGDVSDRRVEDLAELLVKFIPDEQSMIKSIDLITQVELNEWNQIMSPYFNLMQKRLKGLHPDFSDKVGW